MALGLESGNWLKIAVTADVGAVEKVGQSHHADEYCARVVAWTTGKLFAEMVRDELMAGAERDRVRLGPSFVAMTVAGCRAAIDSAAARAGVDLYGTDAWVAEVERAIR